MSDQIKPSRRPGRPPGALQKITSLSRLEAQAAGILPHEWLLKVVRGEPITQSTWKTTVDLNGIVTGRELVVEEIYPDFAMRQDAAKAAAPYYAPKLAVQYIALDQTPGAEEDLKNMSPEALGAMILELSKTTNRNPQKMTITRPAAS